MRWSKVVFCLVSCSQNKALTLHQCPQDFSSSRLLQLSALAGCTGLRQAAAEHYSSFFKLGSYLCVIKLNFHLKPPTISTHKSSTVFSNTTEKPIQMFSNDDITQKFLIVSQCYLLHKVFNLFLVNTTRLPRTRQMSQLPQTKEFHWDENESDQVM